MLQRPFDKLRRRRWRLEVCWWWRPDVVQAPNDKNHVEPMLGKIDALPEELGEVEHLLADTGYFSADNVAACEKADVEPVIAMGRQPHHPPLSERFEKAPDAPKDPTPVEAMAHKLRRGWSMRAGNR